MAKKTTCPISREDFQKKAKAITVTIAGSNHAAEVKQFATGSFGWYLNGRTSIEIDGQPVPVLINASLIIIGSKELPPAAGGEAPPAATEAPAESETPPA